MNLSDCTALFEQSEWADALVWASVLAVAGEDVDLKERLYHLHVVQASYLAIWRGQSATPPGLATFTSLRAIRDWARGTYRELREYLPSLEPDMVEREVRVPWADYLVQRFGVARPTSWAETVLQVNLHSTYHRGQVNTRLRALGSEPPLTDFIAWILDGPSRTRLAERRCLTSPFAAGQWRAIANSSPFEKRGYWTDPVRSPDGTPLAQRLVTCQARDQEDAG